MLGRWIIALLLANLGWLAWSQGWLQPLGWGPARQAEPQRLQRQVRPEALQWQAPSALPPAAPLAPASEPGPAASAAASPAGPVASAAGPASATEAAPAAIIAPGAAVATASGAGVAMASEPPEAPASVPTPGASAMPGSPAGSAPPAAPASAAPGGPPVTPTPVAAETRCLQTGSFDADQLARVRAAAAALPPGSWRIDEQQRGGRWMVHLPLADAAIVITRRAELRAQGIDTDAPGAAREPGLSLGRFSSEAAAERALAELGRKGVRGARVVPERRATSRYLLRLPKADAELDQRARALDGALAERDWRACD